MNTVLFFIAPEANGWSLTWGGSRQPYPTLTEALKAAHALMKSVQETGRAGQALVKRQDGAWEVVYAFEAAEEERRAR